MQPKKRHDVLEIDFDLSAHSDQLRQITQGFNVLQVKLVRSSSGIKVEPDFWQEKCGLRVGRAFTGSTMYHRFDRRVIIFDPVRTLLEVDESIIRVVVVRDQYMVGLGSVSADQHPIREVVRGVCLVGAQN